MRAFEARFWEMERSGLEPVAAGFTPEQVQGYVLAAAEHGQAALHAKEVLLAFPRDWWAPAIEIVLHGERVPGAWKSDVDYVEALCVVEPERFASDPIALIARRAQQDWFFRAHRETVVPPLRAALAEAAHPFRNACAAALLGIDPAFAPDVQRALDEKKLEEKRVSWDLQYVGFVVEDGVLRRLAADAVYVLAYRPGYLTRGDPAASKPDGGREHPFGGRVDATDAHGRVARMHHVLTLDPVPAGLGVSLPRLVLAVDLADLMKEGTPHPYAHGLDGVVIPGGDRFENRMFRGEEAHPAIRASAVVLVAADEAARSRGWGGVERVRCDRLGGLPIFVQDSVYPRCETCIRTMTHLLSLDSSLPLDGKLENGWDALEWGSGGVANVFWCDRCRISSWEWACT